MLERSLAQSYLLHPTLAAAAAISLSAVACGGGGGNTGGSNTGGSGATSSTSDTNSGTSSSTNSGIGGGSGGSTGSTSTGSTTSSNSTTTSSSSGTGGTGGAILAGPYSIVWAGTQVGVDSRGATDASFSGNALTGFLTGFGEQPSIGAAQAVNLFASPSSGTPLILAGRWAGGQAADDWSNVSLPADGGVQYVIGTATSPLATTGAPPYTLEHAGPTTVSDGSLTPGTATGSIGVTFAGDATKVGVSLQLVLPGDQTYSVSTTGGASTPATSELEVFPTGSSRFGGIVHPAGTTGACAGTVSCTASVFGFFAGPSAEKVGIMVHVYNNAGGAPKTVSAGFVFTKS